MSKNSLGIESTAKDVGTAITNSTVVIEDDELFANIEPNSTYSFKLNAKVLGPASAGFKFAFDIPPLGVSLVWGLMGDVVTSDESVELSADIGDSITSLVCIRGMVTTRSDGGKLQFKWAQLVADTTATAVEEGSFIEIIKVL